MPQLTEAPFASCDAGAQARAAGNTLGLRQDGDQFSVTPATSDINIGPLSHFVGFMAPQRAEMELLRKGTSGEAPKIWNLIQAWRREGAQGPAAAAKACR